MPKHIQTLEVLDFCIANDKLYFVDKKSNFCSANKTILSSLKSSTIVDIKTYETHIILNDRWNYGLLIYDHTTDKIIFKSDDTVQILSWIDPVVIGENLHVIIQEECENYGLLNLTTGNIYRISFEACHSFPTCSYVFNWIKDENLSIVGLAAINPETGSEVWRFTEKRHLGLDWRGDEIVEEISKVLGVYDNRLWLAINPERIVALNLETGKIEREYFTTASGVTNSGNYAEDDNVIVGAAGVQYLPEEKKLVYFTEAAFCEFDLTSANPHWECHDISNQLKELDLDNVMSVTIRGNYICFNRRGTSKIGVFDRIERKIVWHVNLKDINPSTNGFRKIDMTETHLYALDNKQHLFVFERADI